MKPDSALPVGSCFPECGNLNAGTVSDLALACVALLHLSRPSWAAAPPGMILVMKMLGSSPTCGLSVPPAMLKPRPELPCRKPKHSSWRTGGPTVNTIKLERSKHINVNKELHLLRLTLSSVISSYSISPSVPLTCVRKIPIFLFKCLGSYTLVIVEIKLNICMKHLCHPAQQEAAAAELEAQWKPQRSIKIFTNYSKARHEQTSVMSG